MAYAFKNLDAPKNYGMGIGETAYFAPVDWFATIATPVAPFANEGDEITILTPHTFKAGYGWKKIRWAPQKNKLDAKVVGDLGTGKYNQDAEAFYPGNTPADHLAMQKLLNQPCIFLLPDANCGSGLWYQLGCDCQSAWLSGAFSTGTTKDGTKGFLCPIVYDGGVQFYQAEPSLSAFPDTLPTLAAIVLLTLSNITATTAKVAWAAIANATNYAFDISVSPTFSTILQTGTTGGLNTTFNTLTTGTTYYVRVRPTDITGTYLPGAYATTSLITA